jgi:hypothetical protein
MLSFIKWPASKFAGRVLIFLATGAGCLSAFWPWHFYSILDDDLFSADLRQSRMRAYYHVSSLAVERPPGSAGHQFVQRYLLEEIKRMGFRPEIQRDWQLREVLPGVLLAGNPANIIVKVTGKNADAPAALFMAHYDSVPFSRGAGDNGMAVAALLELLQYLSLKPPAIPVIVAFTDSEESGLLGAAQLRGSLEAGFVFNFDARGNAGPVHLFQQGTGSAAMLADVVRHPAILHNSFSQFILQFLPHATDFELFRSIPGLNFAAINGAALYHTAEDRPDLLDQTTLAWMVLLPRISLKAAEAQANSRVTLRTDERSCYYSMGRTRCANLRAIYYSCFILPAILLLARFFSLQDKKQFWIRLLFILRATVFQIIAFAAIVFVVFMLWLLVSALRPELAGVPLRQEIKGALPFKIAFLIFASIALQIAIRRMGNTRTCFYGALVLQWGAAVIFFFYDPQAGAFFILPAFAALAGLLLDKIARPAGPLLFAPALLAVAVALFQFSILRVLFDVFVTGLFALFVLPALFAILNILLCLEPLQPELLNRLWLKFWPGSTHSAWKVLLLLFLTGLALLTFPVKSRLDLTFAVQVRNATVLLSCSKKPEFRPAGAEQEKELLDAIPASMRVCGGFKLPWMYEFPATQNSHAPRKLANIHAEGARLKIHFGDETGVLLVLPQNILLEQLNGAMPVRKKSNYFSAAPYLLYLTRSADPVVLQFSRLPAGVSLLHQFAGLPAQDLAPDRIPAPLSPVSNSFFIIRKYNW